MEDTSMGGALLKLKQRERIGLPSYLQTWEDGAVTVCSRLADCALLHEVGIVAYDELVKDER